MGFLKSAIFTISLSIFASSALAQSSGTLAQSSGTLAQSSMDPSSALLLNPNSNSNARSTGRSSEKNDSGSDSRYTVRPRSSLDRSEKTTASAAPKPKKTIADTVATPAPIVLPATEQGIVVVPPETPTAKENGEPPALVESHDEVMPSGRHILEIGIATAYLYENAESGYSYRQANMGGPAYAANARAWLTPEFGIGGEYFSTLGGQVSDRGSAVAASRTQIAYGIYLKKVFAQANLTFGVEYVDSQFKVAAETVSKLKTRSSGVRVSFDGEFLSTPTSSWALGFSAMPKLQHEESAAATVVRSGSSVDGYAVGASICRHWKFDSSNAVYLRLEHHLERDLFSGTASAADPIGGATPTGVAATVGTTLIQFGYSWGD